MGLLKKKPETLPAMPEDIQALIAKMAVATSTETQTAVLAPSSNVELTNKVVDTLFDMIKRKMLGILSKRQIAGIKKLYLVNDIIYNNRESILTRIIDNEIDLSVSENGKGREQLVKLTKVEEMPDQSGGRFRGYLK